MLKYQEKHPKHFHYHLSDLKSSCVHHGEQVTTGILHYIVYLYLAQYFFYFRGRFHKGSQT